MASRLSTTFIAVACLFGKFMFNEGAPTYVDESESYDVISDMDLEYDATNRERAKFPSIQLPKPFLNNDRPEPHPQPVESKPKCAEKTKPSFSSNSGLSSPENMSFLARMVEHQRLAPATAPSFLPDANFRPFFLNPLQDVTVSIVAGNDGPPRLNTFNFAVPPNFSVMDLLSRLATDLQLDQGTLVPVSLKKATDTCQEIDHLGPLTASHDVITITIKDNNNQVLWNSECLPGETFYILPGYNVKFHHEDNGASYSNYSVNTYGR